MRPWDLPSFPGVTLMSGRAGPGWPASPPPVSAPSGEVAQAVSGSAHGPLCPAVYQKAL